MITVVVCYKSTGKPAKNVKVALGKNGLFTGGVTSGKWTDSRGEVHFDTNNGSGQIFVNGRDAFRGHLAGRHVVYV
jgi:hypothetical protein